MEDAINTQPVFLFAWHAFKCLGLGSHFLFGFNISHRDIAKLNLFRIREKDTLLCWAQFVAELDAWPCP